MDRRVKERLIGATILVALIVLIVPELLSGPRPAPLPPLAAGLPNSTRNVLVDLATSNGTPQAQAVDAATEGARGTRGAELAARIARYVRAPLHAARDVAAACAAAWQAATPADRVVIFGSFHTVGPAMDWLEAQGLLPPQSVREYTALLSSS